METCTTCNVENADAVIQFNGDLKFQADQIVDQAYQKGFDDGAVDAWDLAKWIFQATADELIEIFGSVSGWSHYSYTEANQLVAAHQANLFKLFNAGRLIGTNECRYTGHICDGVNCQDCAIYSDSEPALKNKQKQHDDIVMAISEMNCSLEDIQFVLSELIAEAKG